MQLKKLWFDKDYIYIQNLNGAVLRQSILFYPTLMNATKTERDKYTVSTAGIHWRELNEDISFESFSYPQEPTPLQRFFLTHKEINIAGFARYAGINASLLRNYINGFKTPSQKRENQILEQIRQVGVQLSNIKF